MTAYLPDDKINQGWRALVAAVLVGSIAYQNCNKMTKDAYPL